MIPRFIITGPVSMKMIERLQSLGYHYEESSIPDDLLVIGRSICKAVPGKNKLVVCYNKNTDWMDIIMQAKLHLQYQDSTVKAAELNVGDKGIPVYVNNVGVLIDSFVVRIEPFVQVYELWNVPVNAPRVATHSVSVNPSKYFLTIGCADYSLNDINEIIKTYKQSQ